MLTKRQKQIVQAFNLPENAEVFFASRKGDDGKSRRGWYVVESQAVRFLGKSAQDAVQAAR